MALDRLPATTTRRLIGALLDAAALAGNLTGNLTGDLTGDLTVAVALVGGLGRDASDYGEEPNRSIPALTSLASAFWRCWLAVFGAQPRDSAMSSWVAFRGES